MKLLLKFIEQVDKQGNQRLYVIYNYPFSIQQNIDVLINYPEVILLCDSCQRKLNLSASVLFLGEETKDYCFTCFNKLDFDGKKYYYFVRPNLNMSITQDRWSIASQLLLINALQRYGYGNWGQVKNYLDYHSHNFKSADIQAHFIKYYLTNDLKPAFTAHLIENNHCNSYAHQLTNFRPLKNDVKLPEITIQAYNPKRQEHLFDYDKQAQLLICDLEFLPSDSSQEIQIKMAKLQQYDYRIQQRQKRQAFVIEHDLLSQQYHRRILSNGKTKNAIKKQLDGFSRFMSREQANNLSTLKSTILQLTRERRKTHSPTFNTIYEKLHDKKIQRSMRLGECPLDLNIIHLQEKKQLTSKRSNLEYVDAVKQIKQVSFIDAESNITMISWGK